MKQPNLRYWLCGGTGINIGRAIKESPPQVISGVNKAAEFVALDSSGANSANDLFPVERMPADTGDDELARGSGKVQSKNYPKAVPFIREVLGRYKPGVFNVIVCSTSGGTGPMLATMLARELITRGNPVVFYLVSDHSSVQEMQNSVQALRSLAAQTSTEQLNRPIPFMEAVNDAKRTRGEVNKSIVGDLNLLSVFLTEQNEENDYEDIFNLLNYSQVLKVPAALSRVRFYNKEDALSYEGKLPVAVCSLFSSLDAVVPRFVGAGYRATGVFGEINAGIGVDELHMTLDHGEALKELGAAVDELEQQQSNKTLTYTKVQSFGSGDDNGMCFG